jgi:hypothetical protein
MRTSIMLRAVACSLALFVSARFAPAEPRPGTIDIGDIRFDYDENGISALGTPNDPYGATVTPASGGGGGSRRGGGNRGGGRGQTTLGLNLKFRVADGDDWKTLNTRKLTWTASAETGAITYSNDGTDEPLHVTESFRTDGRSLDWIIDIEAVSQSPVHIGDLSVIIPTTGPSGGNPTQIFEHGFLNHRFVSGHGSFLYVVRASGAPPFLLVTVLPGTKLEYTDGGGRGAANLYIHSSLSGGRVAGGTWRQPHTALDLAPGERASYGLRLQFARSYDDLRDLLFREGLFDVRVVPGMTVPSDLTARISLHTKAQIERIEAEYPDQTTLTKLPEATEDHHLYEVAFRRLGENKVTIHHDGGRETYLEFFVTEPLETLIKKRAAFIAEKQQIKDSTKWYDGAYGPYDMRAGVTRTVDDPDIFVDRMVYVLTCDDPGLCKAPYIASKNVSYPDQKEIESLEYHLQNFVWGGLQRKDDERPYPYGVYGTPHWYINRDPQRRKAYAESLANAQTALRDLSKEHVWRSYDYPHVVMLYFHMYQIAKFYPEMSKYLDAPGYLQRAWETARAFYTYPYEIYPEYYETYKWGLYNELVVLDLIEALEEEGFSEQAQWLRKQWEIKTKYFVYDDRYPFRSEYAFDRTAFESTYAFAKYGATRDMQADHNLWYDVRRERYYSHPFVRREHSRAFMDRQLAAGLSVRGWLNPAYYQLGCDGGVSYMAAMGGWGILDYGINFAPEPWDWLQLGYASYLSSWCLMNTGRPESNYGFWFPGLENDGAAGWQFQSAKVGGAWMGSSYPGGVQVPRGPWWYDGEIDLGFGGALRMARTIVANDPVFGWIAYGGTLEAEGDQLSVKPRDGLRRRFCVVIPHIGLPFRESQQRLKLELDRDGFSADKGIALDKQLNKIAFTIESRVATHHATTLRISLPAGSDYDVLQDGKRVPLEQSTNWDYPWRARLEMSDSSSRVEIVRKSDSGN